MVSNEPFVQNAITLTGVTVTNKQPAAIQTVSSELHIYRKRKRYWSNWKKDQLNVDAWKSFEKSLTNASVPCTPIDRYPVIARWRNDVDYTAAGIYCFQPYCVTGELNPPANPLICP